MNKRDLSERDICTKFITPAIMGAKWDAMSQIGEGIKTRIKQELLTQCNLHTIVRLPNGVFSPYTGIKTNLLFFTKGEPTKAIWYYEHPYPPRIKSYNKTKPGLVLL
jgi:type I restriction-modification system DNA methylase subunit